MTYEVGTKVIAPKRTAPLGKLARKAFIDDQSGLEEA